MGSGPEADWALIETSQVVVESGGKTRRLAVCLSVLHTLGTMVTHRITVVDSCLWFAGLAPDVTLCETIFVSLLVSVEGSRNKVMEILDLLESGFIKKGWAPAENQRPKNIGWQIGEEEKLGVWCS